MPFFWMCSFISHLFPSYLLVAPPVSWNWVCQSMFSREMQTVLEGWFVLFLFYSEHLLLLSVWVCLVLLSIAFPSAVSPALMDSSILQARHFRRRPREARMLWYFSLPWPFCTCFIWHRSLDCGKPAANCSEKFWGCPKLVQYKEFF